MGRIIDVAALVLLFSVGSRTLAPQYSPGLRGTLLLLLADFVVISLYRAFIYPKFFSPLRHLATPPDSHWFWGQTRIIWREPSGIPHSRWIDEVPNDGIIKYNNWFMDRVFISSPKALGEVLVTKSYDFVKPAQIRRTLASILGVGILLAEGDEHRRQRKMLMPAFAFRHIKELYPAFWAKSHQLVDTLAKASRSEESREHKVGKTVTTHAPGIIEVYEQASKATLDIIGASGMGHDFNTLENPDNRLTRAYASIFSIGEARSVIFRLMTIFIPPWIIDNLPMRRNKTLGTAMSEIQQVCQDLVDESREALREKPDSRRDIISVALESGGFNDEELRNQMTTFLLAGHETTSTSLTWAIYLLCKHPDVQAKLRAEIRASIPPLARSREVTSAHIDDCHYLQAVCSEVLRLWSPVPMTMRVTANDTSVSGHFIPKGTLVVLATWAVNRAVSFWGPDAKEFRPERWLDATGRANNRGGAESNYSFLTFLHGPRSCIGQKFAEAEFACLLAAWVGRYETEFEQGSVLARDEEPEIKGGITTKPRDGVWVKLTEVEGW